MGKSIAIPVFLSAFVTMIASAVQAQSGPYQYYSLTPCRVIDTRDPSYGSNGAPGLTTAARDFQIRGHCSIPATAQAVSINVTVTSASGSSWLTIWPSGTTRPLVSTINFDSTTPALANGAIVGVSSNTNDLTIANAIATVHVIVDVTGYFQ